MNRFSKLLLILFLVLIPISVFTETQPIYWPRYFRVPSEEEENAHVDPSMAPCLICSPQFDGSGGFIDYVVDFKADHLPVGTFIATCNFDIDTTALLNNFDSVSRDFHSLGGYCGFQVLYDGKGCAIMTIWDVYGHDKEGNTVAIQAKGVYPEEANFERNQDSTQGNYIHCLLPYELIQGLDYRTEVKLRGSRISFSIEDLSSREKTLLMEYEIGYNSDFLASPYVFLQDFSQNAHGKLRSLVLANFRVRDYKSGRWAGTKKAILSEPYNSSGSFTYGTDGNSFYFMTSGIPDLCEVPPRNATFTVTSVDSKAPY